MAVLPPPPRRAFNPLKYHWTLFLVLGSSLLSLLSATVIINYKFYNLFIVGHVIIILDKVVKRDRHKEKRRRGYELF